MERQSAREANASATSRVWLARASVAAAYSPSAAATRLNRRRPYRSRRARPEGRRRRYYRRRVGPSRWLLVVVSYEQEPGRIVTALATRSGCARRCSFAPKGVASNPPRSVL